VKNHVRKGKMQKNTRLKDITTRVYSIECKGCVSQELEFKLHPHQTNFCLDYLSVDCPCQTCLVKVTCTHFCDKVIRKLKELGIFTHLDTEFGIIYEENRNK
jgi:hypothetical protein